MIPDDRENDAELIESLRHALGIASFDELRPQGGLFGAHPIRALLKAEGLIPHNRAELAALLDDLRNCAGVQGLHKVQRALRYAHDYWSARLQLAIATLLLAKDVELEFEVVVDRGREIVTCKKKAERMLRKNKHATEIDIHLLESNIDIEVAWRRPQFFRTFDPEYLAQQRVFPDLALISRRDIVCDIRASSLVLPDNQQFKMLERYFLQAIPAALEGSNPEPFTSTTLGITVTFRSEALHPQNCHFKDTIGLALDDSHLEAWLHLCYTDETPLDRFFEDFKKLLGNAHFGGKGHGKMEQLRKYPQGRIQVLAIGFPHTLVRYSEAEGESGLLFRKGLQACVLQWQKSTKLLENSDIHPSHMAACLSIVGYFGCVLWIGVQPAARSSIKAFILNEFGYRESQHSEGLSFDHYRFPVLVGNDLEIDRFIAPLAS